ncbi:zona pellucida sperm-binding protein 3-like [Heptranchias perlo]|uniref:zona pellucida sperm-binding protein 3-like n=1 Tax=Heptranchias perlo TaxID=212740 RepID=UPI0035594EFE
MNDDWLPERTSTVYYLGDLIHIEASVSMTNHMPLKLYIDSCAATLSPDKDSTPRYNIIDYHGCLLDSKAEDSFSTFVLPRVNVSWTNSSLIWMHSASLEMTVPR